LTYLGKSFFRKDSIKGYREEGEKGDSNEGEFYTNQEIEEEGRRGEKGRKSDVVM